MTPSYGPTDQPEAHQGGPQITSCPVRALRNVGPKTDEMSGSP